jgi:formylglycine-generating enzyme required for sulfatase activity
VSELVGSLDRVAELVAAERVPVLVEIGQAVVEGRANGGTDVAASKWIDLTVNLLGEAIGSGRDRLILGELLGKLGDPRIHAVSDAGYWVTVPSDTGTVTIGRFPVTNSEYREWCESGGYDDEAAWSGEGLAWRDACEDAWPMRAGAEGSEPFVVANQPVVGVTWFEADAFARAHNARLPHADERVWVIRGRERRPYPWGSPFGEGNANTREEVLGRPCAVGLYPRDRTPEGVYDLAGNAAEWTQDMVGNGRLIHPGAWDQPSMAAWAKALSIEAPDSRWAGLGFRLACD